MWYDSVASVKKSCYKDLIVGSNMAIPVENGNWTRYINFDNAATTPPFTTVMNALNEFAPWYSAVHRGVGFKSRLCSRIYEDSREEILRFVKGESKENVVIFVKNTTEAINKLAFRICDNSEKCIILSTEMEHHSNDLPWRDKFEVHYIQVDDKGRLDLKDLENKLKLYHEKCKLVTVTGVSNVTGYKNDIYKIARLAHLYGTKILVDGAQLLPHLEMDMKENKDIEHIDYLVFSAHKMYAPFGIGVLIGDNETFYKGDPDIKGGGTVKLVTPEYVMWDDPPFKDEAGSPNLMGVVALVAAVKTLSSIGMKNVEMHEERLMNYAVSKLSHIEGITFYGDMGNISDRLGIITFNVDGMSHSQLAKQLSDKYGIAVRNGCFCAQPYIQKILSVNTDKVKKVIDDEAIEKPGMVRVSFGIYNCFEEIDVLDMALRRIVKSR